MSGGPIRVLVADDSAFARKVMREVLDSDPEIEVVGIARDGLDALEKITQLDPDVVALDLLMPNLDGVGVLNALAGKERPRCVVVSTSDETSRLAVEALQAGAFDLVHKPTALATDRLYELSTELVTKVKSAAQAGRSPRRVGGSPDLKPLVPREGSSTRLIVIGTSTGGPQALTRIIAALPAELRVPVAVVLHMPVGYTAALSDRLDAASAVHVEEAQHGSVFGPGTVVIGRAGMQFEVFADDAGARVSLCLEPLDTAHRPSVDVLFRSAARAYGAGVLGVILTGMGDDGLRGSRAIREAGGRILTEAESSCVVYGMPRAVAEAGLSDGIVPLEGMVDAILGAL